MKLHKIIQKTLCIALSASLLTLAACGTKSDKNDSVSAGSTPKPSPASYSDTAGGVKKSETVYVSMDPTGKPTQTIVTDWIHTDKAGVVVNDRSDLADIKNVKTDVLPKIDGNNVTWQMETTDLYYQGNTQKALPIEVSISYFLNDQPIAPAELAGKSGKVRIAIRLKNNEARKVMVNGKEETMFVPIITLGGMILPENKFQNIKMDGGAVIGDANNQIAVFVGIPGLNESLKLDESGIGELQNLKFPDTFTMTADVKDFSIGNMAFAASTDLPQLDLSGMSQPLDELKTSLAALESLQDAVKRLDPDQVLSSLFTGGQNPTQLLNKMVSMYQTNAALLSIMPKYVTTENWEILHRVQTSLSALDIDKILDSLAKDLTVQDMIKLQKLLKDIVALQDIDSAKLQKLLGTLAGVSDMSGVFQSGATLASQTAGREKELATLQKLLGSSDELLGLMNSLTALQAAMGQQGITLTDDDIRTMVSALVEKKAMELAQQQTGMTAAQLNQLLSAKADDMVKADNTIPSAYRDTLAAAIRLAAKNDSTIQNMEAALLEAVKAGSMNTFQATVTRTVITTVQKEINSQLSQKDQITDSISAQLSAIMKQAQGVSDKLSGISNNDLAALMAYTRQTMPTIQQLTAELGKHKDQLKNLETVLNDPEMADFLQNLSGHMLTLLKDLEINVDSLQDILSKIDPDKNPEIVRLIAALPSLLRDLQDAAPVLKNLNEDMSDPKVKKAMDEAPATVASIMKMKANLEKNKELTKALKNLTSPETGKVLGGVFGQLGALQDGNMLGKYAGLLQGADGLAARAQAYLGLSKTYRIFTDAPEGMQTSLAFVMKTDAIRQPQEKQEAPVVQESGGISGWFKKTFQKS